MYYLGLHKYMFAQRQNHLTTHFSEYIPIIKWHISVQSLFKFITHALVEKTKQCTNHNQKQNNAPNTTENKTLHQTWPKTKPCSLVNEDALTQCYYLQHHILITGFSSPGMWQCVIWQVVPSVFKDHSSLIFGALQSFEMSWTTCTISQGNIAENLHRRRRQQQQHHHHHHHHHSWMSNITV